MKNKIALMYDKVTFVTSFIDAHRLSFLVLAESLSQACTPFSHSDLINLREGAGWVLLMFCFLYYCHLVNEKFTVY